MTREERARAITTICGKCGCNDEQRARHYKLFVDENWNVHPSKRFQAWWQEHPDFKVSLEDGKGISAITAQNARPIWQEYLEAKEIGIA